MVNQAPKSYNPAELERMIQKFWKETDAYTKTKKHREAGKNFYFIDGPPYTTGHIHIGTALNKTVKDSVIRFRRMQNHNVRDQAGFDMHGLPIEVKVEKSLNIDNKQQIEDLGIDKFVGTCREFAIGFKDDMIVEFKRLGVWLDWENPYLTINNEYMESAWWTLQRAYDRGLLAQSERVLSWCPRCETALAEAEVEYWDETDPSIYVRFPLKDRENESIVIWTTTPWTLPSNMAAAVHPDYKYAKCRMMHRGREEILWILDEQVESFCEIIDAEECEVLEIVNGTTLAGLAYIHPFADELAYHQNITGKWIHHVICSKIVEGDYTGVVHIAPGHGPDDFEIGKEFDLPPYCPVLENGTFADSVEPFAGLNVKKADSKIIRHLKGKGLLLAQEKITHRYGHCWRCKTGIIYRTTDQWFLKVTALKEKMLAEVLSTKWIPEWAGSSREYDWVKNTRDWCISRQRYWGIPLPIWRCDCGGMKVIGSADELKGGFKISGAGGGQAGETDAAASGAFEDMFKKSLTEKPTDEAMVLKDLHRPWIDEIAFKCDRCGKDMRRVPDVLDVWFDSAVASWAGLGYPKRQDEFKKWWPCKWITESHDQTRGWFYSQLGAGVVAFDECPYKSVLLHGWALDADGKRMSKSLGNTINPMEVMDEFGADALRFYLLKVGAPWDDMSFSTDAVKAAKKTLNILWNVYYFATTYMSLDSFNPSKVKMSRIRDALKPEDHWIISRLESMKEMALDDFECFDLHKVTRGIENFILNDLSRWYVRLIRDRTWIEKDDPSKIAAYKILHETLSTLANLLAPITPHLSEEIYQNLSNDLPTIHMCDLTEVDTSLINKDLEMDMNIVQRIVESGSRARQRAGIKLRWPIQTIVIKAETDETVRAVKSLEEIIKKQLNTKEIEIVMPDEEWTGMDMEVHPQLDVIGPVYRQWAGKVAAMLRFQSAWKIKDGIDKGEYGLGIEGQFVKIHPNMVTFVKTVPEHMFDELFEGGELYLDSTITEELQAEAYAKELIRRIQEMRKELDLDVSSQIDTKISISDQLADIIDGWKDHIANETRSKKLELIFDEVLEEEAGGYLVEWQIEGEDVAISIVSLEPKKSETEAAVGSHVSSVLETLAKTMSVKDEGLSLEDYLAPGPAEEIKPVIPALPVIPQVAVPQPEAQQAPSISISITTEKVKSGSGDTSEEKTEISITSDEASLEAGDGEASEEKTDGPITSGEASLEAGEGKSETPEPSGAEIHVSADSDAESAKKSEEDNYKKRVKEFTDKLELSKTKAKHLYRAGFTDFDSIKKASVEALAQVKGIDERVARGMLATLSPETAEDVRCSLCGAKVKSSDRICRRCGTEFWSDDEGEKAEKGEKTDDEKKADDGAKDFKTPEKTPKPTPEAVDEKKDSGDIKIEVKSDGEGITVDVEKKDGEVKVEIEASSEKEEDSQEEFPPPPDFSQEEDFPPPPDFAKEKASAGEDVAAKSVDAKSEDDEPGEKAKAVIIEPLAREKAKDEDGTEPKAEEEKKEADTAKDDDDVELRRSSTYLFTKSMDKAYELFMKKVKEGLPGICVTRDYPAKVRSRFDMGDVRILWLSNVGKQDAIRPKALETLSLSLERFLNKCDDGGIILLGGTEYLVTNNNFITVLRLIQSLRDQTAMTNSILVLPVDTQALERQQMNLLEQEVDGTLR